MTAIQRPSKSFWSEVHVASTLRVVLKIMICKMMKLRKLAACILIIIRLEVAREVVRGNENWFNEQELLFEIVFLLLAFGMFLYNDILES